MTPERKSELRTLSNPLAALSAIDELLDAIDAREAELAKARATVDVVLDGRDETIRQLQAQMQVLRQQTARECMDIAEEHGDLSSSTVAAIREKFSLESR